MKKIIVLSILLAAILLSAINPWPAQLKVWNYTDENIYFRLSFRGEQKYFLTVYPPGNTGTYYYSVFEVKREKYNAQITACSVTTGGVLDLNTNLNLRFLTCGMIRNIYRDLEWDEDEEWDLDSLYKPGALWAGSTSETPNFSRRLGSYNQNALWCEGCLRWGVSGLQTLAWGQWHFKVDLPAELE